MGPPPGPPLSCQRWSGGAGAQETSPCPTVRLPGRPRRHRLPAGARVAPGTIRGQGPPYSREQRGAPRTYPAAGVLLFYETFFVFYFVSQTVPPSGKCTSQGVTESRVQCRASESPRLFQSERVRQARPRPRALPAAPRPPGRVRGSHRPSGEPAGRPSPLPPLQGHLHNVDLEQLLSTGRELFKVFGLRLNKGLRAALLGAAHPSGAGTPDDFTAPWPGFSGVKPGL